MQTPQVRDRLFRAAERVLASEGPGGVSARSVTKEAGCATGVLYNNFADLDEFLTELTLDRIRLESARMAALGERAGTGTVAGNLVEAGVALLESPAFAVAALVFSRPGLSQRIAPTALGEIEAGLAAYLGREQRLGRLAPQADTQAAAMMLFAALHHLLLAGVPADPRAAVTRLVTVLIGGLSG
ncbi:TetR family transcriptional regulator [Actinomadura sp. 6N118]|uniref:TetR family transcriptional regulator n=1 Tax=Actinomadura sp. 6N118 TaxID=3375151 RepID=UPI0037B098A0